MVPYEPKKKRRKRSSHRHRGSSSRLIELYDLLLPTSLATWAHTSCFFLKKNCIDTLIR